MKRSEKEAEVRRLLETPNAFVLLPKGMSAKEAMLLSIEELVARIVDESKPEGGWEYELPNRLELYDGTSGDVFITGLGERGERWFVASLDMKGKWLLDMDEKRQIAQAAIDAYNAMKEAEEAEADPNDPLTVALERVAAEEVNKLIEDAVEVAKEETLKECAAKCTSKYTREEFVAAEIELSLKLRDEEPEDIDPFALSNIRQRAEWNAQTAERAGVVWRHQSAKVACRNCSGYEWPEKITDYGECHKCVTDRDEAWKTYASSWRYTKDAGKDDGFDAGFSYGYQAGWRAQMDTLNPVCSPKAVDETLAADAVTYAATHEDLQSLAHVTARQHDRISGVEDRLDQHTSSSAVSIALLRESIDVAHDRLQRLDVRIAEELNSLSEKLHAVEQAVRELHPNKES